jgi:hypothetical protein
MLFSFCFSSYLLKVMKIESAQMMSVIMTWKTKNEDREQTVEMAKMCKKWEKENNISINDNDRDTGVRGEGTHPLNESCHSASLQNPRGFLSTDNPRLKTINFYFLPFLFLQKLIEHWWKNKLFQFYFFVCVFRFTPSKKTYDQILNGHHLVYKVNSVLTKYSNQLQEGRKFNNTWISKRYYNKFLFLTDSYFRHRT